ncbi:MAG: hypothetical protein P4L59_12905 [Desulfosporosinus sp.]|nr:hypothetical protein [Desulfosporosinus sp.]
MAELKPAVQMIAIGSSPASVISQIITVVLYSIVLSKAATSVM